MNQQRRPLNDRLRAGVETMLHEMGAGYFVTLNFNRETTYDGARTALKAWHARVDKQLLGGSWSRKPAEQRSKFMAFAEKLDTNPHWHLLLRLGDGTDAERFEQVAAECWRRLIVSGELDVKKLNTPSDQQRTAGYVTKDLWRTDAIEHFVLSEEFIQDRN